MVIMQSWIVVLYIIATKTKYRNGLNAALAVALIWFEIWGSLIRVKQFRFFQANFRENSIFSDNFPKKFNFPGKTGIYSYFWANYSNFLQKSPLSNILPVHDKI